MRSATVCRFCQAEVTPIVAARKSGVPKPLLLVGLLVLLGIIIANTNSNDDPPNRSGGGSANLVGRFISWEPVDDARGYAYFEIENRGSSSAVAECTIEVSNDFGDFGFDILVGERVGAGDTFTGRIAINVGEGSLLIDSGAVKDC